MNRFEPRYLLCFVVRTDLKKWYEAVFIKTKENQNKTKQEKNLCSPSLHFLIAPPLHSFSFLAASSVPSGTPGQGLFQLKEEWDTGLDKWRQAWIHDAYPVFPIAVLKWIVFFI